MCLLGQCVKVWVINLWLVWQILVLMVVKQIVVKVCKEYYLVLFVMIEVWWCGGSLIQQCLVLEVCLVVKLVDMFIVYNLICIFFLQECLKNQGVGVEYGIEYVYVVGVGVMGGDIVVWCVFKGLQVILQDCEMKFIQLVLDWVCYLYEKKFKLVDKVEVVMKCLCVDVDGSGVVDVDLVIEVIYENVEVKWVLYVFIELQFQVQEIFVSNIFSILLDELSVGLKYLQCFFGLYFFNLVVQMLLVEVVWYDGLDLIVEWCVFVFCKVFGKLLVVVKGILGFLVNCIFMFYLLEVLCLYSEGVFGFVFDCEVKKFGMLMGLIELVDIVGLDVCVFVGKELVLFLGLELLFGIEEKFDVGKCGKKDGQGLYVWQDGKLVKLEVDLDYIVLVDLQEWLILLMVNEVVVCLVDGVVDDVDLFDVGVIFGIGFVLFCGGLIVYVCSEGVEVVKGCLEKFVC